MQVFAHILRTMAQKGHKKRALKILGNPSAGINRGDRIRTCDLVLPKHPRYQAAPRPAESTIACEPMRSVALQLPLKLNAHEHRRLSDAIRRSQAGSC